MTVTVQITLAVEAADAPTGQQAIAAFAEPWIRQVTGQQLARTEGGAFDLVSVQELGKAALRRVVTDAFLGEQAASLEAAKAAQLEAIRQQATAGMALAVVFE